MKKNKGFKKDDEKQQEQNLKFEDIKTQTTEKEENENSENESEKKNNESEDENSAEKKAAEYLDRYQRTLAEFDNFRKRTIKEKASMYDDGMSDAVEKLLPIIDNFERAVNSVSEEDKQTALFKGLEMVYKQFCDVLSTLSVEEIEAEGKPFDPNFHNAVMHIEDENFGENEIAAVLQKGYKYKDKVIRPSMVQVAN